METMIEKRLAVVRDVRARIRAEKLRLTTDAYVDYEDGSLDELEWTEQAQTHIDMVEAACMVCARGAVLLSHIRLNNRLTIEDFLDSDDDLVNLAALDGLFDETQISLIEAAYMRSADFAVAHEVPFDEANAAELFGDRYDSDDDRLDAIMANIEANVGVFRP